MPYFGIPRLAGEATLLLQLVAQADPAAKSSVSVVCACDCPRGLCARVHT
jgi:hypothetical protein